MMTNTDKTVLLCSEQFIILNNASLSLTAICECSDIKFPDMRKK